MDCNYDRNKKGSRDTKRYEYEDIEFNSEEEEIQDMYGGHIDIDARSFTMDHNYISG